MWFHQGSIHPGTQILNSFLAGDLVYPGGAITEQQREPCSPFLSPNRWQGLLKSETSLATALLSAHLEQVSDNKKYNTFHSSFRQQRFMNTCSV